MMLICICALIIPIYTQPIADRMRVYVLTSQWHVRSGNVCACVRALCADTVAHALFVKIVTTAPVRFTHAYKMRSH